MKPKHKLIIASYILIAAGFTVFGWDMRESTIKPVVVTKHEMVYTLPKNIPFGMEPVRFTQLALDVSKSVADGLVEAPPDIAQINLDKAKPVQVAYVMSGTSPMPKRKGE